MSDERERLARIHEELAAKGMGQHNKETADMLRADAEKDETIDSLRKLNVELGNYNNTLQGQLAEKDETIRRLREADAVAPVAWRDVVKAIRAVQAEASRRGEMFPQTNDEQRDDRAASRRVCDMIEWYATQGGAAAERLPDWPKIVRPAPTVATREAVSDATPDRIVSAVYGAVFAAMIDGGAHVTQARLSAEKFSERARPAPTVATREAVTEVIEEIRKLRSGAHERDPWRLLFEDWATRLDAALAAPPTD